MKIQYGLCIRYIHFTVDAMRDMLKGVCREIFQVLFWHVWIDLGLYKNLWRNIVKPLGFSINWV